MRAKQSQVRHQEIHRRREEGECERFRGASAISGRTGIWTTRVGLQFPSRRLSFHEWQQAGSRISSLVNSSAWFLGDWVTYGEAQFESRYRQAVDMVGLNYQTLRNFAWVARRFPLARRRGNLSFYHHMEVAKLPDAEQDYWLDRAAEETWSVRTLRQQLRKPPDDGQQAVEEEAMPVVRINAESTQVDRWTAAASQVDAAMEDWIVATLDTAARRMLEAAGRTPPAVEQL